MNGKQGESAYDLGVNMEDWTYQQICSGRMLEHRQERHTKKRLLASLKQRQV